MRYRMLALMTVAQICGSVIITGYGSITPFVVDYFHINKAQLGLSFYRADLRYHGAAPICRDCDRSRRRAVEHVRDRRCNKRCAPYRRIGTRVSLVRVLALRVRRRIHRPSDFRRPRDPFLVYEGSGICHERPADGGPCGRRAREFSFAAAGRALGLSYGLPWCGSAYARRHCRRSPAVSRAAQGYSAYQHERIDLGGRHDCEGAALPLRDLDRGGVDAVTPGDTGASSSSRQSISLMPLYRPRFWHSRRALLRRWWVECCGDG